MGELRDKMDRDMLLNSDAIFGSHAGKFPKTAEHSPPFEKGGSGGISIGRNLLNPPGPLYKI
jgi:hypothetical protein